MPAGYMMGITEALAASNDLQTVFEAVAQAFQAEIGYRLLTISTISTEDGLQATRVWSSHPAVFPVGGTKQLDSPEWIETVLTKRQVLVCDTPEALRRMFYDHEDIAAVNCGSGINVPLILNDEVIAIVNVFHEPSWFNAKRLDDAKAVLALMYAPVVLSRTTGSAKELN
jgi:transcriptional regulator with GAF, ATPase, and Fis domain